MVQKIGMDCGAGDCEENNTTRTFVKLATAHGFFSSAFGDRLLGLLLDI